MGPINDLPMKTKSLIRCAVILLLAIPAPIHAAPVKRKAGRVSRVQTTASANEELRELLRRTQQAVEMAQAEARRAREQSEALQKRLEENTRELAGLRQTIADWGVRIAELKSDKNEVKKGESIQPAPSIPDRAPESGIEERLDRMQEQAEVQAAQIKEHAQSKVESDSRLRVKLYGMILANTYFNTNDSSSNDVPVVASLPDDGSKKNNLGASLRQTRIGLLMEGPRLSPRLGEARLSAEAEFDFWGGENGRLYGDVLGSLRLVTASARLDWEKTSLVVGQRPLLFSPLNPTSIAAVWLSPLTGTGNLSQWRPQITLEHRAKLNDSSQVIIQEGVLMPFGESLQDTNIEGGPGYQSRLAYRRTSGSDRKIELGLGGYFHRRAFTLDRHVNSYAVSGDWMIPLGNRVELSGEAYFGRALGLSDRSGGRNDRFFAAAGSIDEPATVIRGIHSVGAWTQLAIKARPDLDFNFAYGQEDPRNRDILSGLHNSYTPFKNQVGMTNFIWQLRHNFLLSLEFRRLWTNYEATRRTNNHFNLAVGYTF